MTSVSETERKHSERVTEVAEGWRRAREAGRLQLHPVPMPNRDAYTYMPASLAFPDPNPPTYLSVNTPPWGCALLGEVSRDGRTAYWLESRTDALTGRRYLRLRSRSA